MNEFPSRRCFLAAVGTSGVVGLAGCLGALRQSVFDEETEPTELTVEATGETTADGTEIRKVTLAHDFDPRLVGGDPPSGEPTNAPPFSDRQLPLVMSPSELSDRAVDGGPDKDGIRSIDDPEFIPASEADFLWDDARVFGVLGDDDVKAYWRNILVYHEIINDELDGVPVSVTYCPLTGTAQGFERGDTEFGVSGMLINNNVVMYDREADRWWVQLPSVSVPGPWADTEGGATLDEFRVIKTTWGRWRNEHPETTVLSDDTGRVFDYNFDPYLRDGYYARDSTIFESIYTSDRHHAKDWVHGARTAEGAVCFLKETLESAGVIHGSIGETPHVATYDPTLDEGYVYRNPDDERFEYDAGTVLDDVGNEHHPSDLPLESVVSFDAYWFAWVAYYPQTIIYE